MSDQDAVAWTIENLPAGTYDIMTNASLNAGQSGNPFHLTVGGTQADGTIESTGALNRYRARKFGYIRILKAAKEVKAVFHHDLPGPYVSIKELVLIPAR
jgi:hypothetical protein